MDNYQMMKAVELELRKQQKRIRRKQREEERERRKLRRSSRDAGSSSKSLYRREPSLPVSTPPAFNLPPLSLAGLRRQSSGPGVDSEWSGSEDGQSQLMIQRDIIPSPTTSECNFMSEDEFRGEFRFGDEDDVDDNDEEEWERSDELETDETDDDEDEEDYFEDDDEGTPRHSYKAGGEGVLRHLSGRRESPRGPDRSDDAHMAKWRKWDQRHHALQRLRSSDERSGEESDDANDVRVLRARETMMSTLKATLNHTREPAAAAGPAGGNESGSSGTRRILRRMRSASETLDVDGGYEESGCMILPQHLRASGEDWGAQWLQREGSIDYEDDDDEDERGIMLVPEFDEDGAVAEEGKFFFIPFQKGSGETSLPSRGCGGATSSSPSEPREPPSSGENDHSVPHNQELGNGDEEEAKGEKEDEDEDDDDDEEEEDAKKGPHGGGGGGDGDDEEHRKQPRDHDPPPPPAAGGGGPTTEEAPPSSGSAGQSATPAPSSSSSSSSSSPSPSSSSSASASSTAPSLNSTPPPSPPSSTTTTPMTAPNDTGDTDKEEKSPPTAPSGAEKDVTAVARIEEEKPQREEAAEGLVTTSIHEQIHKQSEEAHHASSPTSDGDDKGKAKGSGLATESKVDRPPSATSAATAETAMQPKASRKDKGKERLLNSTDDFEDDDNNDGGSAIKRAKEQATFTPLPPSPLVPSEAPRAAVVLQPPVPGTVVAMTPEAGARSARKEWVWDREPLHDAVHHPHHSHQPVRGVPGSSSSSSSSGSSGTSNSLLSSGTGAADGSLRSPLLRSPREGVTKRSPLLAREEVPPRLSAVSCLSCTLS